MKAHTAYRYNSLAFQQNLMELNLFISSDLLAQFLHNVGKGMYWNPKLRHCFQYKIQSKYLSIR